MVIKNPSLRVQGAPKLLKPIQPGAFITVQGNHFMKYCPRCVDRRFYFAGTNWCACFPLSRDHVTVLQLQGGKSPMLTFICCRKDHLAS